MLVTALMGKSKIASPASAESGARAAAVLAERVLAIRAERARPPPEPLIRPTPVTPPYLSLPPPATIFFARHLSKICLARVLASAMASFGDSAPVAALANMSVIT